MYAPVETAPTSDERLLAALSHVFGLVIALVIWITQKDKSRFVRFQAMQAVAFDVVVFIAVFIAIGCAFVFIVGGGVLASAGAAAAAVSGEEAGGPLAGLLISLSIILPFGINCLIFLLVIGVLVARVVAAVNVYQGRNYHHPWLGERVEKMLG
jgi:uncharacterized Tic20 family protein